MKLGMKSWQDAAQERNVPPTQSYESTVVPPSIEDLARIFPQLEIVRLVGQGGMGAVFQAVQKSLDRTVALKLIHINTADNRAFADRFIREAKALAKLSHPNIVTVYDFGHTDDYYYFLMEYVDGTNLRHLLQTGKMDPASALAIVPHVCDALQYAHDHGIVHRDIKPENILVDKKGVVKIADFGLAKLVNQGPAHRPLTRTNHVMGTMHYMAPEQIEKPLSVDHRADIYSLGVVIYEMLTGELPIGRFARPSQKVKLDVRLDEVVLHALEKEPELRFQQMSQVKSEMESIQSTPPNMAFGEAADHLGHHPRGHVPPVQPDRHSMARQSPMPASSLVAAPPKPGVATLPAVEPTGFFGVAFAPQTWLNVVYLLLSFPLGVFYFVFLTTGFSTGIGLLFVWVGIFVLLGTLLGVRGAMWFERELASNLLGLHLSDLRFRRESPAVWDRVKNLFADAQSWKGVAYLFLKFPLGILSFVAVVTLLATSVSCLGAVVVYQIPWAEVSIGPWKIDTFAEALPFSVLGVILLFVSLHVLNGLTWIHNQMAVGLLQRRTTT